MKNQSQKVRVVTMSLASLWMFSCEKPKTVTPDNTILAVKQQTELPIEVPKKSNTSIQVALLLDTSNSMDGLIDQAKSRLWNIVNTLTTLKYNGETPNIQIALYEYGNDGLSAEQDYIRKVTALTEDLDLISEKLFALRTNGGSEYCGAVIDAAKKQLEWDDSSESMKLVYIAGNESFKQGDINYAEAISSAVSSNIYVNTIFCGGKEEGINLFWKDGALKGKGKYFNIDSDQRVRYIATPYDDEIDRWNSKLNSTYIGYGASGRMKKEAQIMQDSNAESISKQNKVERAVTKSKSAYKNSSWDLVDKYEENEAVLAEIEESALPVELRGKTEQEQKKYIEEKKQEREEIQTQIGELSKKRMEYIEKEKQKEGNDRADDLGKAIERSILEIALTNGFKQQ